MGFHAAVLRLMNGRIVPRRSAFVSHNGVTCVTFNLAGATADVCKRGRRHVGEWVSCAPLCRGQSVTLGL